MSVIADVVTAEDIGKFPDKNVAEALQRVPGIVVNREFGEGERVSLRGTAPNLTKTLLNGHTVATADWFILDQVASTRSFNYLTLPAEIVGRLEVYKSPQADVEEGGVGGTINVITRNPLDLDPLTVSASAAGRLFRSVGQGRSAGVGPDQLEECRRDLRRAGRRYLSEAPHPPRRSRDLRLSLLPGRRRAERARADADRLDDVRAGA